MREHLGSRLGFILLSAGCAIGCGNVWKFPWMCGENGGGCFVIVYLFCLLVLGLPALTMELSIGRASQSSPLYMMKKLEKSGSHWDINGIFCIIGNLALMAFYTVVCGWMIYYFVKFAIGQNETFGFSQMIADPLINVTYVTITIGITFTILCFDLQSGLEKLSKRIMLVLMVLMVMLTIHSIMLPGAQEGLTFYLIPDWEEMNGTVFVNAMNQAFFTLSIGIGSMAIFGSYIGKERSLMGESLSIILLDTSVALMAGLIIFPACATYGLEVNAGPRLLFDTMATVFNHMEGGRWWGTLFFLFMVFAAMSTVLAVCENILAMFREWTGWSRPKGCIACGIVVFLLSLTTALGYSILHFEPFAQGTTWLDFWDFIVSYHLLPLGSLIFAIFCCYDFGWGWDNFTDEANAGKGMKVKPWMKPLFRYIVPLFILFVWIYGLITYQWH